MRSNRTSWAGTSHMDKHNSEFMTGGPWYNTSICKKSHGIFFQGFIRNARTDRYNIMCSIDTHEKEHQSSCDYGSGGGGYPLPSNSTTYVLDFLGETIDFISCGIKALEQFFTELCNIYVFNMGKLFQKILVELPKQPIPKKKSQSLLHAIGGGWYVEKLDQKLQPLKKRK